MPPDAPLPHDRTAEETVLGSLLISNDALLRVRPLLEPADFYVARHAAVYEAMLALHDARVPVDLVTLSAELKARGDGDSPGWLTGLMAGVPSSMHAEHYAGLVHKARVQRELISAASDIARDAFDVNGNLQEVLSSSRARIADVERLAAGGRDGGMDLRQSCDYYMDLLDRRDRDKDKPKLAFPWHGLADLMPYLDDGTLVGLIAEPGVGKTAFLENVAEDWAKDGWRVAFFHYELSSQMMLDRRMQRHSGVPIKRLQRGGQIDDDWDKIIFALDRISRWTGDIRYYHCPGWTMARVLGAAQKLADADGLDVVIVDYLNKVRLLDGGDRMNSAQMIGTAIEELKTSLEVNGWVGLMAAQFDKAAKRAVRRAKTLADARGTGELEDKSNVGVTIDRPRGNDGVRTSNATVQITKCNAGRDGVVSLYFAGERLAFYSRRPGGEV